MVATVAAALEGNALVPATVLADLTVAVEPTPCALTAEEIGYMQRLAQGMTVCDLARTVGRSERDMCRALSRLWKRMRAIDGHAPTATGCRSSHPFLAGGLASTGARRTGVVVAQGGAQRHRRPLPGGGSAHPSGRSPQGDSRHRGRSSNEVDGTLELAEVFARLDQADQETLAPGLLR